MNIRTTDYLLSVLCSVGAPVLAELGRIESFLLKEKLDTARVDSPIYICGLPRSGSTILLEKLSRVGNFATHRYRDYPFVFTPVVWDFFLRFAAPKKHRAERPHKDRIIISQESPEGFEGMIWQYFFPNIHSSQGSHILTPGDQNPEFEKFYVDHLKKILLIRKAERYLSKSNYNVARLEYLSRMFESPKFLVPIRHPIAQVHSLVQQHRLFTEYASTDKRIANVMAHAGHFEFGPQRRPMIFSTESSEKIVSAWKNGDDYRGYAIMWHDLYCYVLTILSRQDELSKNLKLTRFEDLCAKPAHELSEIFTFIGHPASEESIMVESKSISPSPHNMEDISDQIKSVIWEETKDIAQTLGYTFGY
jgi:hypothetical protein